MALVLIPGVYTNSVTGKLTYGYKKEAGKETVGSLLNNDLGIVELSVNIDGDVYVADAAGTDFNGGPLNVSVQGSAYSICDFDTDSYKASGAAALLSVIKASKGKNLIVSTAAVTEEALTVTPDFGIAGAYVVGAVAFGNPVLDFGTISGTIGGANAIVLNVRQETPTSPVTLQCDTAIDGYSVQLTDDADGAQYIVNAHTALGAGDYSFINYHFTAIDDILLDSGLKLLGKFEKAAYAGEELSFTVALVPYVAGDGGTAPAPIEHQETMSFTIGKHSTTERYGWEDGQFGDLVPTSFDGNLMDELYADVDQGVTVCTFNQYGTRHFVDLIVACPDSTATMAWDSTSNQWRSDDAALLNWIVTNNGSTQDIVLAHNGVAPPKPVITVPLEPGTTCFVGVQIDLVADATGYDRVEWYVDGVLVPGEETNTYSMTPTIEDTGAYVECHFFNGVSESETYTQLRVQDAPNVNLPDFESDLLGEVNYIYYSGDYYEGATQYIEESTDNSTWTECLDADTSDDSSFSIVIAAKHDTGIYYRSTLTNPVGSQITNSCYVKGATHSMDPYSSIVPGDTDQGIGYSDGLGDLEPLLLGAEDIKSLIAVDDGVGIELAFDSGLQSATTVTLEMCESLLPAQDFVWDSVNTRWLLDNADWNALITNENSDAWLRLTVT